MSWSDKLTAKVDDLRPVKDDRNDGAKNYVCTPCGQPVEGRWHHCTVCHLTFPQEQGQVRHRKGDYHPGPRVCRTPDELTELGWKHDADANVWRLPDPKPRQS